MNQTTKSTKPEFIPLHIKRKFIFSGKFSRSILPITSCLSIASYLSVTSFACFIHCLLTPFFIGILPTTSFSSPLIQVALICISILSGYSVMILGYYKHKRIDIIIIFSIGFAFIMCHQWVNPIFNLPEISLVLGLVFLTCAHFFNRQALNNCNCCKGE